MNEQCITNYLFASFKWVEETSQFNKEFIKSYIEDSGMGYFPEVDVQYPEKLYDDLLTLTKNMKIGKVEKLLANFCDKKILFCTHTEFVTNIKS